MRVFIDCEWNSYKGELMSIALVPEEGYAHFYIIAPTPKAAIDPWVSEHVEPHLFDRCMGVANSFEQAAAWMVGHMNAHWKEGVHIVADWPEDIARFCDLLIVGPGKRLDTPPLTMEVVRIDAVSKLPRHALYDAEALRDAVLKGEER